MKGKLRFGIVGIIALAVVALFAPLALAEGQISLLAKHTPLNPLVGETVQFSATASGELTNVDQLIIYVDNVAEYACDYGSVAETTITCGDPLFAKTYAVSGTHTYYAKAVDPSGATLIKDPAVGTKSFTVSPVPPAGSNVKIKNFWATPTLLVDKDGCSSVYPLELNGFVQEGSVGTRDGVLIYVEGDLYDFVHADPTNGGYFSSTIDWICFENPGTYTVTANVDRGSGTIASASADVAVIFRDSAGSGGGSESGSVPNLVDVEAMPRILRTGAGTFNEILLSVENLGTEADTYTLKVTGGGASTWLDLEREKVSVNPGQTVYVSLFVDIPSNAKEDSYPLNIIAEGKSTDIDRAYVVVENEDSSSFGGSTGAFASPDYAVDLSVAPKTLTVDAGESGQYVVTVQNIGKKVDTYELDVNVPSKTRNWYTFKTPKVTLNPGEQKDIILFVDVPDSITAKSYPVYVVADGNGVDIERVSLTVIPRSTFLDVMVGKVTLNEVKVSNDPGKTLVASVPVTFIDLSGESAGETVTAKLYVNSRIVGTQNIYIPSGETKDVTLAFSTNAAPISAASGTYNVYVTAGVGEEVDRSEAAALTVVEAGAVKLTETTPTEFNTSSNKNVTLKLTAVNSDIKDVTYTISAEGRDALEGKVKAYPASITVKAENKRTQEVNVEIGNVVDGTYDVTLKVASDKKSDTAILTVNVKGGYIAETKEGSALGALGSGLITFGVGGTLAAILGAVLLAFIFAYYYHTKGELNLPFLKKLMPSEGGDAAMAEAIKKEVEKKPEQRPKEGSLTWESFDFDRLKAITENKVGQWHPKEAENVLLNLSGIKEEFKETVKEAGKLKKQLVKGAEQATRTVAEKISYIKELGTAETPQSTSKQAKKTGDTFVDKVVDSI